MDRRGSIHQGGFRSMQLSTSTPSASADSSLLGFLGPAAGSRPSISPGSAEDAPAFDFAEFLPPAESAIPPIQPPANAPVSATVSFPERLGRVSEAVAAPVFMDARAFTATEPLRPFSPVVGAPASSPAIPTEATTVETPDIAAVPASNNSMVADMPSKSKPLSAPPEGPSRRLFSTEPAATALQTEGLPSSEAADSSPLLNQRPAPLQTAKSGTASSATEDRLSAEGVLVLMPLAQPLPPASSVEFEFAPTHLVERSQTDGVPEGETAPHQEVATVGSGRSRRAEAAAAERAYAESVDWNVTAPRPAIDAPVSDRAKDSGEAASRTVAEIDTTRPLRMRPTATPSAPARQKSREVNSGSAEASPAGTFAMSPDSARLNQPSSRPSGEMFSRGDRIPADSSGNAEEVGATPSTNIASTAARVFPLQASGAATTMAAVPATPRMAEGLPIGQEARDITGIPPRENFAGSEMRAVELQIPRSETRPEKFLSNVREGVKSTVREVGTTVAKSAPVMTSIADSNAGAPVEPSSRDHGAGLSSVGATTTPLMTSQVNSDRAPTPAETLASAHRAVDAVLATAERFTPSTQSVANLKLSVGDSELMIRVEVRAGEVHATFRTDSPELRAALSQEWRAASLHPVEQPLRLAAPVFASSERSFGEQNSGFSGEHPAHGREQPSRSASEFVLPGSLRGREAATANGGDAPAAMPALRVQPSTTQHLHAFA